MATFIAPSYSYYCTWGYAFKTHWEGSARKTSNYGVSSQSREVVYYGILCDILDVHYPRMIDLRCIVFYYD